MGGQQAFGTPALGTQALPKKKAEQKMAKTERNLMDMFWKGADDDAGWDSSTGFYTPGTALSEKPRIAVSRA